MNIELLHLEHQIPKVNVVVGALAVLSGEPLAGPLTSTEFYYPTATNVHVAFLLAAAAIQSEVSLSIDASDYLIQEAITHLNLPEAVGFKIDPVKSVLRVDATIHRLISRLEGLGTRLHLLADELAHRGTLTTEELRDGLGPLMPEREPRMPEEVTL